MLLWKIIFFPYLCFGLVAFLVGSNLVWPFSNKVSTLQQFMAYKAAQEERPKKIVFDQFSSSGYPPMSTMDSQVLIRGSTFHIHLIHVLFWSWTLKCLCFFLILKLQKGMHQLPMHPYQSPNSDSLGVSKHQVSEIRTFPVVSHHSIPVPTSSPFFQIHGAPNGPSLMATSIKQQAFVGGIAEANSAVVGSTVGAFAPR